MALESGTVIIEHDDEDGNELMVPSELWYFLKCPTGEVDWEIVKHTKGKKAGRRTLSVTTRLTTPPPETDDQQA